jgi:hypothetical protein
MSVINQATIKEKFAENSDQPLTTISRKETHRIWLYCEKLKGISRRPYESQQQRMRRNYKQSYTEPRRLIRETSTQDKEYARQRMSLATNNNNNNADSTLSPEHKKTEQTSVENSLVHRH